MERRARRSPLDRAYRQFPLATDWLLARLVTACAVLLRSYRRFGSARLPQTTTALRTVWVFPLLHWYSEPLFNPWVLRRSLDEDRYLPGIDWNDPCQLAFLASLRATEEITAMHWDRPVESGDTTRFGLPNGYFEAGDAEMLYQFVRAMKPRRIIEIGSGHFTKVALLAAERNRIESGHETACSASNLSRTPGSIIWRVSN